MARSNSSVVPVVDGMTVGAASAPASGRISGIAAALSLVGLCYSGSLKATPLLDWFPVELTAFFAISSALSLAVCISQRGVHWPVASMRPSALLWYAFLPGAAVAAINGLQMSKVALLFTVTLLCVLVPCVVGVSDAARKVWIAGQVIVGFCLAIGLAIFPKTVSPVHELRLDIEGGSTITTARALGATAVVLIALATEASKRMSFWFVVCCAGSVIVLGDVFLIGSRGPFVSVLVATPLMLLTGKVAARARIVGLVAVVAMIVLSIVIIPTNGSIGTKRIFLLLSGVGDDPARSYLYAEATGQILDTPEGLGWSGFSRLSGPGYVNISYPHNIFLEIFVEGGWLAGIAFIAFAVVALRRLRSASGTTSFGLAFYGLAIYWLAAAQFSGDINGNRLTWAALAFGFASVRLRRVGRGISANKVCSELPAH